MKVLLRLVCPRCGTRVGTVERRDEHLLLTVTTRRRVGPDRPRSMSDLTTGIRYERRDTTCEMTDPRAEVDQLHARGFTEIERAWLYEARCYRCEIDLSFAPLDALIRRDLDVAERNGSTRRVPLVEHSVG